MGSSSSRSKTVSVPRNSVYACRSTDSFDVTVDTPKGEVTVTQRVANAGWTTDLKVKCCYRGMRACSKSSATPYPAPRRVRKSC